MADPRNRGGLIGPRRRLKKSMPERVLVGPAGSQRDPRTIYALIL